MVYDAKRHKTGLEILCIPESEYMAEQFCFFNMWQV